MNDFIQTGPTLPANTFSGDRLLQALLRRHLPADQWQTARGELERIGARAAGEFLAWADDAETHPPRHVPFSPWGERVDEILTAPGWLALERASAEEGLVATGYERRFGALSRLHQFAQLYLFHPSSAYYTCPLAMTDGAARLIEVHGDAELRERALPRLTSRDPARFWTSGQWMTERSGGSDIGNTETVARLENGTWRLYGTKWFTSAVGSQMAMTLARIEDAAGQRVAGSRGLSLFYLELRRADGRLDRIEVLRLKDKLGTRALPTAELRLAGVPARLVGQPGEGVKRIATLFNVTRLYNACTTVGAWRRLLDLSIDYAGKRRAFGKLLLEHPLHSRTLAEAALQFRACFHLAMHTALLLGREEVPGDDEGDPAATRALLRLLTPVAKLYCAKKNMAATSELIESFGGAGYIEDTGLPRWLRDNQVLCIWEGTTNVLSLDVLRAIGREEALPYFLRDVEARLRPLPDSPARRNCLEALAALQRHAQAMPGFDAADLEYQARDLAFTLGNLMAASLMLEHAHAAPDDPAAVPAAERFCARRLFQLRDAGEQERAAAHILLGEPGRDTE